jgi:AcrR family transcriptional regulator
MEKLMGKRQLQKEATRELIINTALRVYGERGFTVPVGALAQEAGLSHGSVFLHFPTKEDLQHCVLERFLGHIGQRMHELAEASGDLETLLRAFLSIVEAHESFCKRLITEIDALPPDTRALLAALRSVNARHFEIAAQRAAQQGQIRALPLHMMFNTWMGLVHYYLQNSELFAPGGSVLERYKDELTGFYMSLISK